MQFHITLHPDTTAKIGSRGQDNLTATVSGSRHKYYTHLSLAILGI